MNIEIFNHEVLGEMHVFGDEKGLWFWLKDVGECLVIEENRIHFKFKHLDSELKQVVKCRLDNDKFDNEHKFIHEKAVYQLMCEGTSEYCDEFRKWVGEIAYQFDFLNTRYDEAYMTTNGDIQSDFEFITSYIQNLNDPRPIGDSAKRVSNDLYESFFSNINGKPIFIDKSYRNDFTIEETCVNPNYHPSLSKEDIENPENGKVEINIIEQNDEQRQQLIKAFDEGRLIDYTIEEESVTKLKKKEIHHYRRYKGNESTCPSWIKDLVK